jgi:nickel-dependent lactate racemase
MVPHANSFELLLPSSSKGKISGVKTYKLPYGKEVLQAAFPASWRISVIKPKPVAPRYSDEQWVNHALDHPMGTPRIEEIVKPGEKTALIVNDISRLWHKPGVMLGPVLERLGRAGVKDQDIVIVIATGMHRSNTREEQKRLLGPSFFDRFMVINHDCRDEANLVKVGQNSLGDTIRLNRRVVEADRVIATGGIVLHGLAGFAGGSKSVLPGVAASDCIQRNHNRALDSNFSLRPGIRQGRLEGNPLVQEMQEAAKLLGVDFLLNVVVSSEGDYIYAAAGDVTHAHRAGCVRAKAYFEVPVKTKAALVIASPGGYPRDLEMYQSIKALGNAAAVTEESGTIVFLSRCSTGVGSDEWMSSVELGKREEIGKHLSRQFSFPGFVAIKTLSLTSRYRVILVSTLPPHVVHRLHMEPASSLDEALDMAGADQRSPFRIHLMPWAGATVPIMS